MATVHQERDPPFGEKVREGITLSDLRRHTLAQLQCSEWSMSRIDKFQGTEMVGYFHGGRFRRIRAVY